MKKVAYQKILVTHDGSRLASAALPYAVSMADAFKSEVILLQVVNSIVQIMAKSVPPATYISGDASVEMSESILKTEKHNALHNLNKLKDEFAAAGIIKVQTIIAEGIATEEIINIAKKQKVVLIAMSTHGRSGLGRALLGSVADHAVRHASCPVLLIHPGGK